MIGSTCIVIALAWYRYAIFHTTNILLVVKNQLLNHSIGIWSIPDTHTFKIYNASNVRLEYCIIWRMFFIRNMNYLDWASILQWITKYRVLDLMHPVDLFNNAIFQSFTFKVCAIWGYIHITFQLQMNVTKICFTSIV